LHIGTYLNLPEYLPLASVLLDSLRAVSRANELTFVVPNDFTFNLSFENCSVQHCTIPAKHRFFPFYDKVVAAAAFEKTHSEPFLWIDLESFFLQAPDFSFLNCAVGINPVDHKNLGIPQGNPITPLWKCILDKAQYSENEFTEEIVLTTIPNESIYPYYNMGMVFHNTEIPIYQATQTLLEELLQDTTMNRILEQADIHKTFTHQIAFSILIRKMIPSNLISKLPPGWNYPLHLHHQNPTPPELTTLKSVRYDTYFQKNSVPPCWASWLGEKRPDLALRWYYE